MTVAATVRRGTPADAGTAASLHSAEIVDGFLSTLGRPFLTRLYRRLARCDDAFLLVAELDDHAVGFLAVALDTRRFYRTFLVRDGARAIAVAAPRLVAALPHVVETLRYGTGRPPGSAAAGAEILAVAVARDVRGCGAGGALVRAATEELRRRGVSAARVVAGQSNTAAISLYRSCGFELSGLTEIHRGQTSQVLTWS
jgi:ribosomal protein S18 acetylase RimI-like enzyme